MIVFHADVEEGRRQFIKRIVGLPGETIRIEQGEIYIDGKKLEAERIKADKYDLRYEYRERGDDGWYRVYRLGDLEPDAPIELEIPRDHLFVLGDNRTASFDSRGFGTVSVRNVIGVAQYRFFPFDRWGVVR